jgi:leucyl aminopeptidase
MKRFLITLLTLACTGLFPAISSFAQSVGHPPVGHPSRNQYSGSTVLPSQGEKTVDSTIVKTIEKMNADTVRQTLTDLQNFGSRFLMLESRKVVADWLAAKFISYGYTDVRLDSFLCIVNWPGQWEDTLWQYNVIARLEGISAPDEVYVIGGHYDSYSYADPDNNAPGADDNGSAVASAFEVARVMKLMNYQPEATIEFSMFAAEELGLFGSDYLAKTAKEQNKDIRYVLNMDMIANNPDSLPLVVIGKYTNNDWAAFASADAYETYTYLDAIVPDTWNPTGSDSYSYFLYGFPSIFVQECTFSPHWHQLSDTVGRTSPIRGNFGRVPHQKASTCFGSRPATGI